MTKTQTSSRLEQQNCFLESLHKRIANDNGAKADLKRALSGEPKHLRNIYSLVLPHLSSIPDWKQDHIWIPVACLSVYYPQPIRDQQTNFGYSCRQLANKTESEGVERRFRALLEELLKNPQQVLLGKNERQIYQACCEFEGGRIYLLRAIIDSNRDPPLEHRFSNPQKGDFL